MRIDIDATDDAQEKIDASHEGDTIYFHGIFYRETPLLLWSGRDYVGTGSVIHPTHGDSGVVLQDKIGEPRDPWPRWLHQRPWKWIPRKVVRWIAKVVFKKHFYRGSMITGFTTMPAEVEV